MTKMVQISEDVLEKACKLLNQLKQEKKKESKRAWVYSDYARGNRCMDTIRQVETVMEDIEAALDAKE